MFSSLTPTAILAILIAVTVHEWAHAYAADRLGSSLPRTMGRLTLNPLAHLDPLGTILFLTVGIGWGKPVPFDPHAFAHPKRGTAITAAAGPFSNLVLAAISAVLLGLSTRLDGGMGNLLSDFAQEMIGINLGLMAFNLLPVPPLDGSKILQLFVPWQYEDQFEEFLRLGPWILLGILLAERVINFPLIDFWITLILTPIEPIIRALAILAS